MPPVSDPPGSRLPSAFIARPIAHRGLHDCARGIAENSRAAFAAAIAGNYGIELDVQLSADGEAMVFHDDALDRLTAETGPVNARRAAELGAIALTGGGETIPTLPQVLAGIAGRAPIFLEIKDQDGAMGPDVGALEARVAEALARYDGPVAAMSFNPHAMIWMRSNAPSILRGLVSCDFRGAEDAHIPAGVRADLADLRYAGAAAVDFISYDVKSLPCEVAARLRRCGTPVICWTVRSVGRAAFAANHADAITFEGFSP